MTAPDEQPGWAKHGYRMTRRDSDDDAWTFCVFTAMRSGAVRGEQP